MVQHKAREFFGLANHLAYLDTAIDGWIRQHGPEALIDRDTKSLAMIKEVVGQAYQSAKELKLDVAVIGIERVVTNLSKGSYRLDRLHTEIGQVHQTVQDELKSKLFLFVPPIDAEYFEERPGGEVTPPLFGASVHQRFGAAQQDIREAGNCLALERPTGCVFHCMRVLERGVDAVRVSLELPAPEFDKPNTKGWGAQAGKIKEFFENIEGKNPKIAPPAWWKDRKPFYDKVKPQLEALKVAYRDPVAHPEHFSDMSEARRVLELARGLMELLASHLDEEGQYSG
jgi:hypothetical protein